MTQSTDALEIYLEIGKRRIFAGALAWPGWCRSGRDEQAALHALLDYGPRYARVLDGSGLGFDAPTDLPSLTVVERLEGTGTTDFGAPGVIPADDNRPLDEADLHRFNRILHTCWQAFDAARRAAAGKQLRKGPRGGGRELEQMVRHVWESDVSYLGRVGRKPTALSQEEPEEDEALEVTRQAILEAVAAGARGELPEQGPRGGVRWPARYFTRRVAWHVLDHAWEIEDRIL